MDIQGCTEELTVKRKDIIAKVVEIGDGLISLTRRLSFMGGVVNVMTLSVAELARRELTRVWTT